MASRMERYYNESKNVNTRSSRNSNLYNNIYDGSEYSNAEGITTIVKNNEIDIDQIRDLLKNNEMLKSNEVPVVKRRVQIERTRQKEEEKNYDIMDVLNKAKDNYEEDTKNRSLRNTQYNILKSINVDQPPEKEDKESLKDLINTITNTSVLNKMGDKELSLGLLDDLQSVNNTTVIDTKNTSFKSEIKKEEDDIDKSFFTSSLNFNDKDFEQLNDIKKSLKKNNFLITMLVIVCVCLVVGGILFLLYNLK